MLELLFGGSLAWLALAAAVAAGVLGATIVTTICREVWQAFEFGWARLMWWLNL